MTMVTRIGIAAAVALAAFLAVPNAPFAASKKSEYGDKTKCLGGGCTSENPDRTRNLYTSFYKKNSKTKKHSSHASTNN
jgi:hypothetical protein